MDTTKKSPVILSLCTGLLRGLEIGIEHALQQKIRVAAYAEIETFIIANLLAGIEKGRLDAVPIYTNVKTFPFAEFRGKVHGIIGGYPCQPFSVAGNQKGVDDPRHLWPYIKDGIAAVRPVFCFFENVRGHLNIGYEQVRGELQELGYEVREGIYSAEEVGAPHRRDRLFILAIRRNQLANSDSLRNRTGFGEVSGANEKVSEWNEDAIIEQSSKNMAHSESVYVQGCSNGSGQMQPWGSGDQLADTCSSNVQRDIGEEFNKTIGEKQRERSIGSQSRFPAGPGQYQYDWEEKRVIEPGLGCTINGYNFRENLLRGLGNGVVWQTASLAFTDLLSKF